MLSARRCAKLDRQWVGYKREVHGAENEHGTHEQSKRAVVRAGQIPRQLHVENEAAEADDTLIDQRPGGPFDEQPCPHGCNAARGISWRGTKLHFVDAPFALMRATKAKGRQRSRTG